jgi:hypothetical protein
MTRTSSVRRRMSLAVVVISAMVAGLLGFGTGVANAAASTSYYVSTRAVTAKAGKPYQVTMSVSKVSGSTSAYLSVNFNRNKSVTLVTTTVSQSHSYSFRIPASDVTIDARDLLPTTVNTHAHLGKFGSINMTLRNPTSLIRRTFRCPRPHNDIVTGSLAQRSGNLRGTFHFVGNDNYFHTVNKSSLPATVQKFHSTGKSCPGGGGAPCFTGFSFFGYSAAQPLNVSAGKGLTSGLASISLSYNKSVPVSAPTRVLPPASIYHSIYGKQLRSAFSFGPTGNVAVNANGLGGFASGTIRFVGSNPQITGTTHCKTQSFQETYASGNVVAKFDSGGQKTLDGSNVTFASASKTYKV